MLKEKIKDIKEFYLDEKEDEKNKTCHFGKLFRASGNDGALYEYRVDDRKVGKIIEQGIALESDGSIASYWVECFNDKPNFRKDINIKVRDDNYLDIEVVYLDSEKPEELRKRTSICLFEKGI